MVDEDDDGSEFFSPLFSDGDTATMIAALHGPCLDGGINGIKKVKGGTFYLQHPNMRVKGVEVNGLPPIFFTPLWVSNRGKTCLDSTKNMAIIAWLSLMAILPSLATY